MPPVLLPTYPVPTALIRCLVAVVLIGACIPGTMAALAELAIGFTSLHYSSARPVNGVLDVVRQAVIDQTDWSVVGDRVGRHGARVVVVVLAVLLLRGQGPLMRLFRGLR